MIPALAFYALLPLFMQAGEFEHHHDAILPAPLEVWNDCCHEMDCFRAEVSVMRVAEGFMVAIADFPVFFAPASKVKVSQNGKSYACTRRKELPPTTENIECVFIVSNFI